MTVEVKMLHTPGCKACEKSRKTIEAVQEDYDFTFKDVDLTDNPELAAEYQVMSAPGIVIDGELEFQGGVTEKKLRNKLDEVGAEG